MTDIVDWLRNEAEFGYGMVRCKEAADEIERLRNAIYEYAEHVLIMEGTDFISDVVDPDLKALLESICHADPAKEDSYA